MSFKLVNSSKIATAGYSHAAVVTGGTTVYVSGQVSADAQGKPVGEDFDTQLRQVFDNLKHALAAAGAGVEHVVKMNGYIVAMNDERVAAFRQVRGEAFGSHKPASTLVDTGALASPAFLVEIEAIAVI